MCLPHSYPLSSRLLTIRFDYTLEYRRINGMWMDGWKYTKVFSSSPLPLPPPPSLVLVLTLLALFHLFLRSVFQAIDSPYTYRHTLQRQQQKHVLISSCIRRGANCECECFVWCCVSNVHNTSHGCPQLAVSHPRYYLVKLLLHFHFISCCDQHSTCTYNSYCFINSDVRFDYSFVAVKRFGIGKLVVVVVQNVHAHRRTQRACTTCVVTRRTTSFGKSATNVRLNQAFDLTSVMFVLSIVLPLFVAYALPALLLLLLLLLLCPLLAVFSRVRDFRVLLLCGVAISCMVRRRRRRRPTSS